MCCLRPLVENGMTCSVRGVVYVLLFFVLWSSVACTTMKTIDPAVAPGAPAFGDVKAGDTVVVHTRDRRRVRFVVDKVEQTALVARDGSRYQHEDIVLLQRRSFSGGKTALLVGGIVTGVVFFIAAAAAAAMSGFLG